MKETTLSEAPPTPFVADTDAAHIGIMSSSGLLPSLKKMDNAPHQKLLKPKANSSTVLKTSVQKHGIVEKKRALDQTGGESGTDRVPSAEGEGSDNDAFDLNIHRPSRVQQSMYEMQQAIAPLLHASFAEDLAKVKRVDEGLEKREDEVKNTSRKPLARAVSATERRTAKTEKHENMAFDSEETKQLMQEINKADGGSIFFPAGQRRASTYAKFSEKNIVAKSTDLKTMFPLAPGGNVRVLWDIFIMFMLMYLVVALPLRIAFNDSDDVHPIDVFSDSVFLIDMVLSFLTAYEDWRGQLVVDFRMIASNYLRGWFIMDFIATFPLYLILNSSTARLSSFAKLPRLLRLVKLFRLLRLFRARRFASFVQKFESSPHIHPGSIRIVKLAAVVILFAHFSGCMWYWLGEFQDDDPDSWITRTWEGGPIIAETADHYKYAVSFYWAITTLTTVGYGDIHAKTSAEIGFCCGMMLLGTSVIAWITASAASILATADVKNQVMRTKLNQLRLFINGFKLKKELSGPLTEILSAKWRSNVAARTDWTELLAEMPRSIRFDVARAMYSDLMKNSPFFQQFDDNDAFVSEIVCHLHPVRASFGEYIAHNGEPVTDWYIIQEGEVSSVSSVNPNMIYYGLHPGDSFGEVSMFLTQHWECSMRVSSSQCLLLAISAQKLARFFANDLQSQQAKLTQQLSNKGGAVLGFRQPYIHKLVVQAQSKLERLRKAKLKYAAGRRMSQFNLDAKIAVPTVQSLNLVSDVSEKESNKLMLEHSSMLKEMSKNVAQLQSRANLNISDTYSHTQSKSKSEVGLEDNASTPVLDLTPSHSNHAVGITMLDPMVVMNVGEQHFSSSLPGQREEGPNSAWTPPPPPPLPPPLLPLMAAMPPFRPPCMVGEEEEEDVSDLALEEQVASLQRSLSVLTQQLHGVVHTMQSRKQKNLVAYKGIDPTMAGNDAKALKT